MRARLTQNDLDVLVSKYNLSQRLAELEELTAEADARHKERAPKKRDDLKDVWRPDLDIRTAIRARVSAEQAPRIEALQAELAELQSLNRASEERIHATEAHAEAERQRVKDALVLMDKVRMNPIFTQAAGQRLNESARG